MKITLVVPMHPEDFKVRTIRGLTQLLRGILGCTPARAREVAKQLWANGVTIA